MKTSTVHAWTFLCIFPLLFSFSKIREYSKISIDIKVKAEMMAQKKSFKLLVYNLEKKPTRIIIQNKRGQIYFNEKVLYHNSFHKIINLKNLGLGDYDIMILQPDRNKIGVIKIKGKGMEIKWN